MAPLLPAGEAADADPLIGRTLGSYELIAPLGEGGMGKVYLARHQAIGRQAAVKLLGAEFAGMDDVVSRFFGEARAVNDIRHPNIVEVTDLGTFEGQPYIVMEYLEGETLADRLARVGRLDEAAAARVAAQIASALGASHDRGLVHRDLKPANIFLRQHPDYPDFVKVLDFGIAKIVGDGARGRGHHTQVGAVLGTPAYMSPEQCMGDPSLDHRSDVYSLGVVLYAMVTGRVPFQAEGLGQVILAHVQEPPRPPATLAPVSPAMNALVLRALEKRPERRFPDMRAVREALRPIADPWAAGGLTPPPVATSRAPAARTPGPVADRPTRAAAAAPLPELLRARLADPRGLPALTPPAARCLALIDGPGASFSAVAAALSGDPRMGALAVRRANGPAFAGRSPATTVESAATRLGLQGIRPVVIEAALRLLGTPREPRVEPLCRRPLPRALAVAAVLERLAAERPVPGIDAGRLRVAGLLLDAGRVVAAQALIALETEQRGRRLFTEAQAASCVEQAHRAAGVALARRWGAGDEVVAALEAADGEGPWGPGAALRVAGALAAREGFPGGRDELARVPAVLGWARERLRVDDALAARVVHGLKDRVSREV